MSSIRLLKKVFAVLIVVVGANLCGQAQQPPPPGLVATQAEITPLPVTVVEDTSALPGWKRYQFGDPQLFSATLPGSPQYQSEKFPAAQGSLIARLYMIPSATGVYGLNYIESPVATASGKSDAAARGFFKSYMNGFIDGFKKGLQQRGFTDLETKTSPERQVKISGFDGYEQDLTIGPFQGRTQVVFIGRKVYAAIVLWNEGNPLSERMAFFNSFQIHDKR
jgi:hypothetical protein